MVSSIFPPPDGSDQDHRIFYTGDWTNIIAQSAIVVTLGTGVTQNTNIANAYNTHSGYYLRFTASGTATENYVRYDLGEKRKLKNVAMSAAAQADANGWEFAIQGSQNDTDWTLLVNQTGTANDFVDLGTGEENYRYIRFVVGHKSTAQDVTFIGIFV